MMFSRLTAAVPSLLAFALVACSDASTPGPDRSLAPSMAMSAAAGPGGVSAGLQVWLRADAGIGVAHGAPVNVWRDQSGRGRDASWNAGNTFGELAPVFRASNAAIGSRPTVRFDGQHALDLDLGFLVGADYTVIAVNGRDRTGFANFWLAGDQAVINGNLVLGYERPDLLRQSHFGNDLDAVVENYTGSEVWSLDTYTFDRGAGKDLYHNGIPVSTDNSLGALVSNSGSTLGHFRAISIYWFQGDLAEVIVFDRAITAVERLRIEAQLAGKYGFALQLDSYVPCNGPWTDHAQYVREHLRAVDQFILQRLLTVAQAKVAHAAAQASSCGG